MSTNDFIDKLEQELREASRRRVRMELARVPRPATGLVAFTVALAVCAVVAVPLLATRSSTTPVPQPSVQPPASRSVVVGCGQTVIGQLRPGWRSSGTGTVVVGPIAWVYLESWAKPLLGGAANSAAINRSHFIESMAVVNPGPEVTVSIPPSERREISLDYTSVQPRSRFYLSQGASSVTFKPCARLRSYPAGFGRQFPGGFIVSRAQCAAIDVKPAGAPTIRRYLPLGEPCPTVTVQPAYREVARALSGDGIRRARFGDSPKVTIDRLTGVIGRRPSTPYHPMRICRIDHEVGWPGFKVYFRHRRFVGYSYLDAQLGTLAGLQVGDTLRYGRSIYGSALRISPAQGGSWLVYTPQGRIEGLASDGTNLQGKVYAIAAGYVGCPAMTP